MLQVTLATAAAAAAAAAATAARSLTYLPAAVAPAATAAVPGNATAYSMQIALQHRLCMRAPDIAINHTPLQVALPCALFASTPTTLVLGGGTNATFAPPVDFFTGVLLPILEARCTGPGGAACHAADTIAAYRCSPRVPCLARNQAHCGLPAPGVQLAIERRGYFPQGGGQLRVAIPALPAGLALRPIALLRRGAVVRVEGVACTGGGVAAEEGVAMVVAATAALRVRVLAPGGALWFGSHSNSRALSHTVHAA